MRNRNVPQALATLLLASASLLATPADGPLAPADSPGVAPSRYGWEYDLQVADRLYESGYLDAAQKDYEKILTAYSDGSPGIDHAWLGLARVHQAQGQTDKARASLQEVLRRENDSMVQSEARSRYRQLRSQSQNQINEGLRAVYYFEARYQSTSWFNPFGKVFHWWDYRKAKKQYEKLVKSSEDFDPRYLIDPVVRPSQVRASDDQDPSSTSESEYQLSAEELAALLKAQQEAGTQIATAETPDPEALLAEGQTVVDGGDLGATEILPVDSGSEASTSAEAGSSEVDPAAGENGGEVEAQATAEPSSGEAPAPNPVAGDLPNLADAQKAYFAAFQTFREVMSKPDATPEEQRIATEAFKTAKTTFELAQLKSQSPE